MSRAAAQGGVRLPHGENPASAVRRHRERAPEIRFLTLAQIDEQLGLAEARERLWTPEGPKVPTEGLWTPDQPKPKKGAK